MTTKDQLRAIQSEIESHVENLRQLRKEATMDDASDWTLERYAEAIKWIGWGASDLKTIIDADPGDEDDGWPEPDGFRLEGGSIIPTTR